MRRYPFSLLAFSVLAWSFNATAAEFNVTDLLDIVDANPGDGKCSTAENTCTLRAAIQESNSQPGADIVNVPTGFFFLSLGANQEDNAAGGDLDLLDSIDIRGAGVSQTIIDGMQRDRIFDIHQNTQNNVSVHISGMIIQNGSIEYKDGYGGAIYNDANLTISDVNFLHNQTANLANDGGALFNMAGSVKLERVDFNTNTAVGNGGALVVMNDGTVDATTVSFNSNRADSITRPTEKHEGGAVFVHGTLIARDSKFQDNSSQYGGAVYIHHGSVTLNKVELSNNTSVLHGGAIHVGSHAADLSAIPVDLVMVSSKINNNVINGGIGTAGDPQGAGLFVTGGSHVYAYDTEFSGNDARSGCSTCQVSGGAIASDMSNLILNKVQLRNNKAARFGGAIYSDIRGGGAFELNDSIVSNNAANIAGGGLSLESGHNADGPTIIGSTISNSLISNNSASFGGGIAGSARIVNSTISRNQADGAGAGIYVPTFFPTPEHRHGMFQMDLTHVTIADNSGAPAESGNQLVNNIPSTPAAGVQGSVVIRNSIVSGGSSPQNCTGPITSKDYNLDSDGTCNLTGANDKKADPRLLPLANNGGPTQTHALDPQSPASSAIPKASCLDLDQRYYYRSAAACDIGAFEFGAIAAQTGTVQFALAKLEINERDGTLTINVERIGGSQGSVSIDYMVMPMTATLGNSADPGMAMPMAAADAAADFSISSVHGMLSWADGDVAPKQISVTVVADEVLEATETFQVELRNPIGPVIGTNSVVEVSIIDKSVAPPLDAPVTPAPTPDSGGGGNWGWLLTTLFLFRGRATRKAHPAARALN